MIQQKFLEVCPNCMGKGKNMKPNSKCIKCSGIGVNVEMKEIEVPLEKGIKDGQKIVLRGESHQDPNFKEHGDLILIVNIEEHDTFKRIGDNLLIKKRYYYVMPCVDINLELPI